MNSLKDYVKTREMRHTGGSPESADFHSKNYHRHFEGYSEYKETDAKGKTTIRRVYTGLYHRQLLTDKQQRGLRLAYVLLWIGSALLFIYSATRYIPGNSAPYVIVPEASSLFGMFWMLWSLFNYITAGKSMTSGDYRYVRALKKSALFASGSLAAAAIAIFVYMFLHLHDGLASKELLCMISLLASAVLCYAVSFIEGRIPYESFTSTAQAPSESNQIDS